MNERIVIIAPVGSDAERMGELLHTNGFKIKICLHGKDCRNEMLSGAGALLFTEEALELSEFSEILGILENQPPWSELPVIILTNGGEPRLHKLLHVTQKAAGSITLLERPLASVTLLRSVEVALRSRRRQYQVRDLIEKLNGWTSDLEQKVEERTVQLEEQAEHLRHLAVELTKIEEGERKRLAQILHDHLQQLLVAAKLRLDMWQRKQPQDGREALDEVQAFLQQAYEASRSLTAELRPPVLYEGGLIPALYFLVRKYREQHGLTVHLIVCDEIEPQSDILKIFIYQSVRELIFNVIKYAGVSECFLRLERQGQGIFIQVKDNGVGFNAFDIGKKRTGGFGLFSIRERIKALGGELRIVSSPGNGSTFEIEVADFPETRDEQELRRPERTSYNGHKSGALRIVIADDHKIVRQSLAKVLEMQSFVDEVIEAEDGRDAILKVEEFNPDIVVMDLNMPHLNGLEATRILHGRNPQLKIIGLSVQAEEETAQAMKKAGAMEYFNKNADTDILVAALKNLVVSSPVTQKITTP